MLSLLDHDKPVRVRRGEGDKLIAILNTGKNLTVEIHFLASNPEVIASMRMALNTRRFYLFQ